MGMSCGKGKLLRRLPIESIATISLRYSADEPLVSLASAIGVADLEDSRGGAGAYA